MVHTEAGPSPQAPAKRCPMDSGPARQGPVLVGARCAGWRSGSHAPEPVHAPGSCGAPEAALGIETGLYMRQLGQPPTPARGESSRLSVAGGLCGVEAGLEVGVPEDPGVQLRLLAGAMQAGADELVDLGLGLELEEREGLLASGSLDQEQEVADPLHHRTEGPQALLDGGSGMGRAGELLQVVFVDPDREVEAVLALSDQHPLVGRPLVFAHENIQLIVVYSEPAHVGSPRLVDGLEVELHDPEDVVRRATQHETSPVLEGAAMSPSLRSWRSARGLPVARYSS